MGPRDRLPVEQRVTLQEGDTPLVPAPVRLLLLGAVVSADLGQRKRL